MEWWRDERGHTLTRDYFRVESRQVRASGSIAKDLTSRKREQPRWFLHGLFA